MLKIVATMTGSYAAVIRRKRMSLLSLLLATSHLLIVFQEARARHFGTNNNAMPNDVIALKEGADLDLSCPIVVNNEDLIISWTCDNEPANIRSSRIHVTDSGVLRIRSAKLGDSCNYRCEAADGYGTLSMIVKVVIVDSKIVKKLAQQNQTLPEQLALQQQLRQLQHTTSNTRKTLPQEAQIKPLHSNSMFERHQQQLQRQETNDQEFNDHGQQVASPTTTVQKLQVANAEQQEPSLEIEIEPPVIHVKKNHTFSLECKVRHTASDAPQIIWLKEFIGRKPDSLSEAHEQNLIIIDNVYYHSLNWPRSITNWSNSANSALLVRQSTNVHSGHYICFAGYPPTIMSSRSLSFDPQSTSSIHQKRSLRYRMAIAEVKVDNPEPKGFVRNLLIGNNWILTSSVICLLVCLLLFLARASLAYFTRLSSKIDNTDSEVAYTISAGDGDGALAVKRRLHHDLTNPEFGLTQQGKDQLHFIHNLRNDKPFETIIDPTATSALDSLQIDQEANSSFEIDNNNHLYSVIDDHDKTAQSEQHYKIPKSII